MDYLFERVLPAFDYIGGNHKFGKNTHANASSSPVDIIRLDGLQYWSDGAFAADINITSSDDADSAAGAGIQTLFIGGLNKSTGFLQSETVAMGGTAGVNPTLDYYRVDRAYGVTVGGSAANVGNISIADGSGTMAYIAAGESQTNQAAMTIPAGIGIHDIKTAYILKYKVTLLGTTAVNMDFVLQTRDRSSIGASPGPWRERASASLTNGGNFIFEWPVGLALDPLTDVRVTAIDGSNSDLTATASFDVVYRR